MQIKVKVSTMVKPTPEKPRTTMRLTNLDLIMAENYHTRTNYFYRSTGADDFFDTTLLKAALGRTLSEFYPMAGRLKKDINGRIEIDCNGEGAVFVEAEADEEMDDIGEHFAPRPDICLSPKVDYSQGISSFPLLLVQVTRFKCGGVCMGVAMDHQVKDGISALHFMTSWCEIARGLDISVPPYLDRRVLTARSPPQPMFDHIEFHPQPPLKNPPPNLGDVMSSETKFKVLKLTREQINTLKANNQEYDEEKKTNIVYSSFEVFTGHLWKCMCKALQLPEDQETKLTVVVDGRSRLKPPLPPGYFGNAVFKAAHIALSGEVVEGPVRKIREALARMDDEYLRSTIDYLEVQGGIPSNARGGSYKSPNIGITSWARLPFYDTDFGWGRPFHVGLGTFPVHGHLIVLPTPINDGSLSVAISLPEEHMDYFQTIFYDI